MILQSPVNKGFGLRARVWGCGCMVLHEVPVLGNVVKPGSSGTWDSSRTRHGIHGAFSVDASAQAV